MHEQTKKCTHKWTIDFKKKDFFLETGKLTVHKLVGSKEKCPIHLSKHFPVLINSLFSNSNVFSCFFLFNPPPPHTHTHNLANKDFCYNIKLSNFLDKKKIYLINEEN